MDHQEAASPMLMWESLSVNHAMMSEVGFPMLPHNEIRDPSANLLKEVCTNVCINPLCKLSAVKPFI